MLSIPITRARAVQPASLQLHPADASAVSMVFLNGRGANRGVGHEERTMRWTECEDSKRTTAPSSTQMETRKPEDLWRPIEAVRKPMKERSMQETVLSAMSRGGECSRTRLNRDSPSDSSSSTPHVMQLVPSHTGDCCGSAPLRDNSTPAIP